MYVEIPCIGDNLAVFKYTLRLLTKTGIIRGVSGLSSYLPSRYRVTHFRSRHEINCGHLLMLSASGMSAKQLE